MLNGARTPPVTKPPVVLLVTVFHSLDAPWSLSFELVTGSDEFWSSGAPHFGRHWYTVSLTDSRTRISPGVYLGTQLVRVPDCQFGSDRLTPESVVSGVARFAAI